jgi:hypothetical protein
MPNRFGELPTDRNGKSVQTGGATLIEDDLGVTSPQLVGASALTLTVPPYAVEIEVTGSEDVYFSPDASVSASHGVYIPAGIVRNFPVKAADIVSIVRAGASDAYVSFDFIALEG